MRLVFAHGWAFDRAVWRELRPLLSDYVCVEVELGFLGAEREIPKLDSGDVLVGHSLGFVWGLNRWKHLRAWVAINGFARFVGDCVTETTLRVIRRALKRDAERTVVDFYRLLGLPDMPDALNAEALREGLDWLSAMDATADLASAGAPGLVLAGENDPLVPVEATRALASAGAAFRRVVWHAEAGHMLPLRDPAWCADNIRKFLDECAR